MPGLTPRKACLFSIKTSFLYLSIFCASWLLGQFAILGPLTLSQQAFAQPNERALENRTKRKNEKKVEKRVAKGLERNLEKRLEKQMEKKAENAVATKSNGMGAIMSDPELREEALATIKEDSAASINPNAKSQKAHTDKHQHPLHDITQDKKGFYRIQKQWLILAEPNAVEKLKEKGFEVIQSTQLASLDKVLLEIKEPENQSLSQVKETQFKILKSSTIDYNHIFQTQASKAKKDAHAWEPKSALHFQPNASTKGISIGLIDTRIDLSHHVFKEADIQQRSFIEAGLNEPSQHGTAVASVLVGNSSQYQGLLPNAKLYSASVFYDTPQIKQAASVKSLLLALDWLAQKNITIINMSLAGPENSLLQYAIENLSEKGITILAAAGNNGPTAPPAFPAAYKPVIAVTAVNKKLKAYFKSNRGEYIDVAAPGVNIKHALPNNQYATSSGTSYAVPFVSALIAYLQSTSSSTDVIDTLMKNTKDLGKKGIDEIYGSGLIQAPF